MTNAKDVLRDSYYSEYKRIKGMQAGVELDSLIAERVMGWKASLSKTDWWEEVNPNTHSYRGLIRDFRPSTDLNIAWKLIEDKRDDYHHINVGWIDSLSMYSAGFTKVIRTHDERGFKTVETSVKGETAPLAICRAVLIIELKNRYKEILNA